MGKGDRRTSRGKRYRGSYGNSRPHSVKSAPATKAVSKGTRKPAARKRAG